MFKEKPEQALANRRVERPLYTNSPIIFGEIRFREPYLDMITAPGSNEAGADITKILRKQYRLTTNASHVYI